MARPTIALQLYTLRDLTRSDIAGVLKQVADMGYEGVEPAGYGNLDALTIKRVLDDCGLKVVGNHVGFDALNNSLQTIIDDNLLLENKYVVCPSIPGDQRSSADGYKKFAETLNEIGARLNSNDMVLCYHNHAFEFEDRFDGQYGLDILYENSEPQFVQAEIDTYWVQKGRVDPASYIRKYAGRAPLIHIKDMANDESEAFAEIGQGKLNWPDIFAAAEEGGATALIVEQDVCPGDPIDSVRLSIENLKKMGKLD